MYSSGDNLCMSMCVSKTMKRENIIAPPIAMALSTISEGKNS